MCFGNYTDRRVCKSVGLCVRVHVHGVYVCLGNYTEGVELVNGQRC